MGTGRQLGGETWLRKELRRKTEAVEVLATQDAEVARNLVEDEKARGKKNNQFGGVTEKVMRRTDG